MTDRRRVNGPPGGTALPAFASSPTAATGALAERKGRTRVPLELRKIFLKTGLTPSASGSAYFELEPSTQPISGVNSLRTDSSGLKLTCTVHGPRPLPRSATFSPHLLLSTHVKFTPFAARERRGYIRDSSERDLGAHLETALRGILIGERWPKSGLEVIITVIEGEEDDLKDGPEEITRSDDGRANGWGLMSILSGCITVASAAIADAGIDCVDLVTGGFAAIVRQPSQIPLQHPQRSNFESDVAGTSIKIIVDPDPSEQQEVVAACVVGYLQSRDEITEIWVKGDISGPSDTKRSEQSGLELLIDQAIGAAFSARLVLAEAIIESTALKIPKVRVNIQGLTEAKMQQKAV